MLAYTDVGKGTETIVFVHGVGQTKRAWLSQLELANKYRLIMVDLRGHGETELDTDISIRNFASDVIELLKHLEIESAFVCGLSLGGIVCQEIYRQSPSIVKGLILSNTTSYIDPLLSFGVVQKAIYSYRDNDFIDYIVDRGLHNKSFKEEAKKAFLIRDSYLKSLVAPIGLNYFPTLMTINKPVLLIGSTYDQVTPLINLWCMKLCLPGADVRILNGGHLSNIENREDFNYTVDEFITNTIS